MAVSKRIKTATLQSSIEGQGTNPDLYRDEENFLDQKVERDIRIEELNTLKEHNKTLAQNTAERKIYARDIFRLTVVWSGIIFFMLFLKGWHLLDLSDKVIIALVTSTTANFFGFFFLVTKYLFNVPPPIITKTTKRPKKAIGQE